jgi:large exoprotein involved in heme utilization and adhesion
MNPNGIVFGPNSSLDVGGSFVATTSDAIVFDRQSIFSANPEAASQLLEINPSAFLFTQTSVNSIENQSRASERMSDSEPELFGLRVPDGSYLLFLGGDLVINGGGMIAFDGRVDVGGVASPGQVNLEFKEGNPTLAFPENAPRANIFLNNSAGITVSSNGSGEISFHADNLDISQGSTIEAGIQNNLISANLLTGNINISVAEALTIEGAGSSIFNTLGTNAEGTTGDLVIKTGQLNLRDGAQLGTLNLGSGVSGNVRIFASERVDIDGGLLGNLTGIFSQISRSGIGRSGDIHINTQELALNNGGQVNASVFGVGNSGNVKIEAERSATIEGAGDDSYSGIFVQNHSTSEGVAGNLNLDTQILTLRNGGRVSAGTFGQGDVGQVSIHAAEEIILDGTEQNSFILNNVLDMASGNTAGIYIDTGSLSIYEGSQIQSEVSGKGRSGNIVIMAEGSVELDGRDDLEDGSFIPSAIFGGIEENGQGQSGNVEINAGSLRVTNRAQISSTTEGLGNAGDILIDVQDDIYLLNSIIISEVTEETGVGEGGDITVTGNSLSLTDGSALLSDTEHLGNAGNILIDLEGALILQGKGPGANNPDEILPSQITATVEKNSNGNGGNITIYADSLSVIDEGFIRNSTFGSGNSGNIFIDTSEALIDGSDPGSQTRSRIEASTESTVAGNGGLLDINTDRLTVSNGARISTSTSGSGNAGALTVTATEVINVNGTSTDGLLRSNLNANTFASGQGGRLFLSAPQLNITDGAGIAVSTFGSGNAGDLIIQDAELIEITGSSSAGLASRLSAQTEENSTGQGGSLDIQSNILRITDNGSISARSFGTGTAGTITLRVTDTLGLENGSITTEASNSSGGNIFINTNEAGNILDSGVIILRGDSDITTESVGNGGNIAIFLPVVAFDDSDILARSQDENGGNITLESLFSDINPPDNQAPFDDDGRVDINADGQISSGNIVIPDTSFIQSNLTELSDTLINPESLLANSCVARNQPSEGTFTVTGNNPAAAPDNTSATTYPIGAVRTINDETRSSESLTQPANQVLEPEGIYQLADGRLVMSRTCL